MSAKTITEKWKPVLGFEGLYEVSSLGRVRALFSACRGRHKPGRILRPKTGTHGYFFVALFKADAPKQYRMVHRMVLESFVGPCPMGQETRHLDGVKPNCKLSNLKWGTKLENGQDRSDHGTVRRGEKCTLSKLKADDVLRIRELRDCKTPFKKIASMFNVCPMVAWRVGNRKTWKHVPESAQPYL